MLAEGGSLNGSTNSSLEENGWRTPLHQKVNLVHKTARAYSASLRMILDTQQISILSKRSSPNY